MNTFVAFTVARKQQIDHMRNRVMTERPTRNVWTWRGQEFVSINRPLSIADYAVYAALRGADYRKGDHTGGKVATAALRGVISQITYWIASPSKTGEDLRTKWMPEGQTADDMITMKDVLEAEIAKWENA